VLPNPQYSIDPADTAVVVMQYGPQRLHSAAAHKRPARRRSPGHVLAAQHAKTATAG
jgi:hypothetical protein